ncbi:MAG: hypothetical protein NTV88_03115 [Candidatus Micrarchaeota archaeon]|nr:hypothetical protein [Candidatus Micrarchaeota archaeon]
MGVFVGGKGVKMDPSWEVKPFTYELTWFWYANDSKDRSKLDSIMQGRIQIGKNASASVAGNKAQAWAANATNKQKFSAPAVTVPSEFFRSMMNAEKETKANKIKQHSF